MRSRSSNSRLVEHVRRAVEVEVAALALAGEGAPADRDHVLAAASRRAPSPASSARAAARGWPRGRGPRSARSGSSRRPGARPGSARPRPRSRLLVTRPVRDTITTRMRGWGRRTRSTWRKVVPRDVGRQHEARRCRECATGAARRAPSPGWASRPAARSSESMAAASRRGQGLVAHQAVHVDAIALVGGHAAGAGVRVVEVPELLEVGHDVAQGGGGERTGSGRGRGSPTPPARRWRCGAGSGTSGRRGCARRGRVWSSGSMRDGRSDVQAAPFTDYSPKARRPATHRVPAATHRGCTRSPPCRSGPAAGGRCSRCRSTSTRENTSRAWHAGLAVAVAGVLGAAEGQVGLGADGGRVDVEDARCTCRAWP